MKRKLIILVTFLAGLYYFLEFMVPPRIGGAPDADGAASATMLYATDDGRFAAYTGLRGDEDPVILDRGTDETPPRMVIRHSVFRHDDYRGAQAAQIVILGTTYLYYIGLGYDNKMPRLCLAVAGLHGFVPLPRAILGRGRSGEFDFSGITWASVLPPAPGEQDWRLWYIGRLGNIGTVGYATSPDGIRWTKRGPAYVAPGGTSVESVSVVRTSAGAQAWMVISSHDDEDGSVFIAVVDPASGGILREPRPVPIARPSGLKLVDLRASWDEEHSGALLAAITASRSNGKPSVSIVSARLAAPGHSPMLGALTTPTIAPGAPSHTTYLSDARTQIDDLMVVIGAFAIGLGLISLAQVHGKRIARRLPNWPESVAFFVAVVAMSLFTVYDRTHESADLFGKHAYNLLFYGIFQPLGSAMFSLLAAYLVSAAYRAFRVRTLESSLMAASAVLIMLGQVPIGYWLTQKLPHGMQIPTIMTWVLFVTNNAVVRAVNFGLFVGALATALRVWLSMDRTAMRFDE